MQQIADATGHSYGTIWRAKKMLHAAGVLKQSYVSGGERIEKGKKIPRKASVWTINADTDEILRLLKPIKTAPEHDEQDIPEHDFSESQPNPYVSQVSDNPFEALRPLRKDEAAALIEAARQYTRRASFIEEKMEEFKAFGLTLNPQAIGFEADERLQIIGLVVPYIDRLERDVKNLDTVVERQEKEGHTHEVRQLRDQLRLQTRQLEDYVKKAGDQREYVAKLEDRHRNESKAAKGRIEELELENRNLKKAMQGLSIPKV